MIEIEPWKLILAACLLLPSAGWIGFLLGVVWSRRRH